MTGPSVKQDADSRLTPHRLGDTWFQINDPATGGADGQSDHLWFRGGHMFDRDLKISQATRHNRPLKRKARLRLPG
jgi:hypothetical protein